MTQKELNTHKKLIQTQLKERFERKSALKDIIFLNESEGRLFFFVGADGMRQDVCVNLSDGTVEFDTKIYSKDLVANIDKYTALISNENMDIDSLVNRYAASSDFTLVTQEKVEAFIMSELINKAADGINNSREMIAKALNYVYAKGLYSVFGYSNIYEYRLNMYDLSRGSVNAYINIIIRFYNQNDFKGITSFISAKVMPEYEGYSFTQLNYMKDLTLSEIQSLELKPEMSTREILEKIKACDRVKLEDKASGIEEEFEDSEAVADEEAEEAVDGSTDYINKKSATTAQPHSQCIKL